MGRYMLNKATIAGAKNAASAPAPGDPTAGKDADEQIYELIGGQAKAHVGQQVEVVGTVQSAATGAAAADDRKTTAHPIAGRITVKTLRVLSTTCR